MKRLLMVMSLVLLTACNPIERLVYRDNYVPVYVIPIIPTCPVPESQVAKLTKEQLKDDGFYVKAHVVDDTTMRAYAACNRMVIEDTNIISREENQKNFFKVPDEKRQSFIDMLQKPVESYLPLVNK